MKRILFMIGVVVSWMFATVSYGGIEIDKIVAIVNNEAITLSELERIVLIESKEVLKGLSGEEKAKAEGRLKKDILKGLIERRLQLQMARRLGIVVSKEEVKEAIEDIKKRNSLNDAEFENALAKENMTPKEYEDELRDRLIMAKLVNQEVKSRVVIGDNDIASYYERNKKDFSLGGQVRLSHIFLKISDKTEERDIKEALNRILGKLRSGEDFVEVAKAYSHGPTAGSGGSLGFLKKGEIAPELEEVAFSLKVGEISDPIWTRGGVHILKIESRVENEYKRLEDVGEEIRKILIEKEMEKIYRDWISGLMKNSFIEVRM